MPRLDSVEKLAAGLGMDLKTLVNLDDAPTVALLAVPVEARGVALLLEGRSADTIARVRRAVEVVLEAEDV